MPKIHLTEAQVEAGERYLKGSGDRNDAALWSKVRGRLEGEERWRAAVDLSVREALLAAVENGDPYVLYELAREAVDRLEPWLRVRLQEDLHELGAGMGVPLGTREFPGAVTRPDAARLVRLLAKREEWNEKTELKPKAKEELDFTAHRVTRLLKVLEGDGAIDRRTDRLKSGKPGRPEKVRKVALIPEGRAYLATFEGPQLGRGAIRTRRYVPPRPLDEAAERLRAAARRAARRNRDAIEADAMETISLKEAGLWPAVQFRWLEGRSWRGTKVDGVSGAPFGKQPEGARVEGEAN